MAAHDNSGSRALPPFGETPERQGLRHELRRIVETIAYRMRTDEDLMRFACGGDGRAFDEVVRRHRGRIYALATGVLDDAEAAGVLTDAFVSAYRDREAPESRNDVKAWLYVHAARAMLERFVARHPKARSRAAVPAGERA